MCLSNSSLHISKNQKFRKNSFSSYKHPFFVYLLFQFLLQSVPLQNFFRRTLVQAQTCNIFLFSPLKYKWKKGLLISKWFPLEFVKVILSSWKLDENWLKIHCYNALHFFVHLFLAKLLGSSTCPSTSFFWLLSHVIYLELTRVSYECLLSRAEWWVAELYIIPKKTILHLAIWKNWCFGQFYHSKISNIEEFTFFSVVSGKSEKIESFLFAEHWWKCFRQILLK